ncbi:hypothetical protein [Fibrella aquatica]|uniref:hypothetical protein n=1 Tax=Fibrella aquatica TaxID=3242487 RepID=UPI003520203A
MKKKLVAAAVLVLLSTSATFAQMGGVISTQGKDGTAPGPQATNNQTINFSKGNKLADVGGVATSGGGQAGLKLTPNALVLEKYTMVTGGDDMGTHANEVWSIPLSGAVKELVFQADGNMAVLDTNGKALWSTGTGGKGDHLKFYPDGVLEIFDKAGASIWRK